jgi:cytoskeletal protein RodZ
MLRHIGVLIVALVMASALIAGCEPKGAVDVTPTDEPSPTAAPHTPSPTPEEAPTSPPEPSPSAPPQAAPEVPEDARAAVAWARQDLASRLNVSVEGIALVSIEAVEWRDSSLGCPQPGQMYLQVITPGYRFVLRADDATYEYHSARGADQAVLCESAG